MSRYLAACLLLGIVHSLAFGIIVTILHDAVDDRWLILSVQGQDDVRKFNEELNKFQQTLWPFKEREIEDLLGKHTRREGAYAMPVAQARTIARSGLRYGDATLNKDHVASYAIGDYAGIDVWYGIDGETPHFALLYFKVDKTFPKLVKIEDKRKPQVPVVTKRNDIDYEHYGRLESGMSREKVIDVFSVPAGDYSPGTDYLSGEAAVIQGSFVTHSTEEWRSDKGRAVIEFTFGKTVNKARFYKVGRDPVTNIAERLAWDRERFQTVVRHVEGLIRAKQQGRGN